MHKEFSLNFRPNINRKLNTDFLALIKNYGKISEAKNYGLHSLFAHLYRNLSVFKCVCVFINNNYKCYKNERLLNF